jgi:hydroxymethylbilane synthase
VIGTRGSKLAIWQAEHVRSALVQRHKGLDVEIKVIRTKGDAALKTPLYATLDKGLFTREIQQALQAGAVDLAVHSLKDLPTDEMEGLTLGAVTAREDPADVLVSKGGLTLRELPRGCEVLTGSLRRRAQILAARPDVVVSPVRGNVDTRLRKFSESAAQAIVFAGAGLIRLGLADRIAERLEPAVFVPACGQGALGIEIRADDAFAAETAGVLDDFASRAATTAERAFLEGLGGGCQVPVGAYAEIVEGNRLSLTGMAAALDGSTIMKRTAAEALDTKNAPRMLGLHLARMLVESGCRKILDEARAATQAQMEERE